MEEQLRLKALACDATDTPMLWIARDGSFLQFNEAAVRAFGHSREALASMTLLDLAAGGLKDTWDLFWKRMLQDKSADDRSQAIGQLVWALLASTEFRVNH